MTRIVRSKRNLACSIRMYDYCGLAIDNKIIMNKIVGGRLSSAWRPHAADVHMWQQLGYSNGIAIAELDLSLSLPDSLAYLQQFNDRVLRETIKRLVLATAPPPTPLFALESDVLSPSGNCTL